MEDDEDIDIYGDLTNFEEKTSDDRSESYLELKKKCAALEDKVTNLEKELESLRTIKNTLEVNLSSLMKTAKTEIARKDRMIAELRAQVENVIFRRGNHRNPNANHQSNNTKSNLNENQNQYCNNSTTNNSKVKVEPTESHVNNVEPAYIKPSIPIKHDDYDDDEEEDYGGEIYQPNKFASTVYGERLQKKLLEEKEAEKLQKEQTKFVASTSEKTEIIHEPENIPNASQRDNKENQCQETTPSVDIDENLEKKSLKRSNDEAFDAHYDKRIKLDNNKNENMPRRDDVNISKTHEKNNYRLAPIEICSETLNRKQDEEIVRYKRVDDQRDNYYDKYRRHCSNSRSRSRDSYHSDKRRDTGSRNKDSDWRHDIDKSKHYRSSNYQDFQNKYEMRRDSRSRAVKNFSHHNENPSDARNSMTEHHRRQRDDNKIDHRYKNRDDKDLHKNWERSEGRQHHRSDDNHKHDSREYDRKNWDRKFFIEHSSDKGNELISSKKSETQILLRVKENIVVVNTEVIHLNSSKENEILNNSVSIPKKNSLNNIVINNKLNDDLAHKILDTNLLNTLSVETSALETSVNRCPKSIFSSPQEEKIENIEAFIRNFTPYEASSSVSPTMKKELFNGKIEDIYNATINITETLEFDANDINKNILPSTDDNVSGNSNHNDEKQKEHSPIKDISSNSVEVKENLSNLKSEIKVMKDETISINNVSTSYADVLSKYTRKKKKSSSSDIGPVVPEDFKLKSEVKNTEESGNKINNEPILPTCSQAQQKNVTHNSIQNDFVQTPFVLVDKPPVEITSEKNEALPKVTSIVDENRDNVEIQKEVNEVKIVKTNSESSKCTTELLNAESQINSTDLTLEKNVNVTDESVKKNEKPIAKNDATISQQSNINKDSATLSIDMTANDGGKSHSDTQKTVEITDKIVGDVEKKINKSVEKEPIKCLKIEKNPQQNCEINGLENVENKINDCKSSFLISKVNEKKIVVVRRKKRPVRLANSSSSITIVASAYSVNNNRICKSKMKTSVTLSDT
ncbi:hypothetical protein PV325_003381 [Microctonus aethiopoides]|uniref:Uncharacterized protein n=1 Tax=Microctonus aethiopoides TaxID=144406 RepID=A0AA39FLX0_9HYME|nr:hypothetical protein PV325_003381 [Microctonus aethiopoides]KAK0172049.1 hypothetical protein PV328_005419 [Microctonus aethiopoides]